MPKYLFRIFILVVLTLLLCSACALPNYYISNQMVEKGNERFDSGDYEQAISLYDKAIKANQYNATAYGNKSAALSFLERYEEALSAADKALDIAPKTAVFHLNKGDALNGQGEYEKAIVSFDEALKLDFNYLEALRGRGSALYHLDKLDEALQMFNQALKVDSSYYDAYLWKAQVLKEQKKYEEALDACDRGISRDRKNPEGYNKRAQILLAMNRKDEAMAAVNKAIALNKDNPEGYVGKLTMLYDQKDYEECVSFGEAAIKKFPQNEDIHWYVADAYAAQYMHNQALKYYLKTMEINPENDEAAASAASEYFYQQDYQNAEKYVDKALALHSSNYEANNLKEELQKTKLPAAERIVDFVKSNYLYINQSKDFDVKSKDFLQDKDVTALDVAHFINAVKLKSDMFTFVVTGNEYDALEKEDAASQVEAYELTKGVHYIRINAFTPTVGHDFRRALKGIKESEKTNLVIDLRGNSGGLIDASNEVLDDLLGECTTSYIIDRNGYINSFYSDANQMPFKKILVLVDEYSASSAELLTLGLKKYLPNVVVIGHPTFGKGVGQNIYEDKKGKYMIFLVGFYWNVREENIAGSKIYPDVKISGHSNEEYSRAIKAQLQ